MASVFAAVREHRAAAKVFSDLLCFAGFSDPDQAAAWISGLTEAMAKRHGADQEDARRRSFALNAAIGKLRFSPGVSSDRTLARLLRVHGQVPDSGGSPAEARLVRFVQDADQNYPDEAKAHYAALRPTR